MAKRTEGAYENAYKSLKYYVLKNTVKFYLEGEAKASLLREIEIIEHNLRNGDAV